MKRTLFLFILDPFDLKRKHARNQDINKSGHIQHAIRHFVMRAIEFFTCTGESWNFAEICKITGIDAMDVCRLRHDFRDEVVFELTTIEENWSVCSATVWRVSPHLGNTLCKMVALRVKN